VGCPPWASGIPGAESTFRGVNRERSRLVASRSASEGRSPSVALAPGALWWGIPSAGCRPAGFGALPGCAGTVMLSHSAGEGLLEGDG